jgi:HSP20 family protein
MPLRRLQMATLTRFQPEVGFTRLPDMIDQLFRDSFVVPKRFGQFFDGALPANLIETENAFIVQLALPGITMEQFEIQVVGQQLTVKAAYVIPVVEKATYLWRGLTGEEFSQVFTLPAEVLGEKAEASYEYGILTITLPKTEYAKPKMVKVNTIK